MPVLIIDNANRLAQKQPELLDLFQDYAKLTADKGTVSVVFVSSEGNVPRRMMRKLIYNLRSFICYVLIKCYREKLVVEKGADHGR